GLVTGATALKSFSNNVKLVEGTANSQLGHLVNMAKNSSRANFKNVNRAAKIIRNIAKNGGTLEKVVLENGETAYKINNEYVRSLEFVDDYGNIKWPDENGFVVDEAGNAITQDANLKSGQILDRYGASGGRFTSPIENGKILDYNTRGVPYPESVKPYHQYEIVK